MIKKWCVCRKCIRNVQDGALTQVITVQSLNSGQNSYGRIREKMKGFIEDAFIS